MSTPVHLATTVLLHLAFLPAAWSQSGSSALDSLADGYATQRSQILQPVVDLEKLYEGNLGKLREKARTAGKLKEVLAIDAELEGFREAKSPEVDTAFPELARLQAIYRSSHASRLEDARKRLAPLTASYREQLEILRANLTRQDKIDKAVLVAAAIEDLREATTAGEDSTGIGDAGSDSELFAALEGTWTFTTTGNSFRIGKDGEVLGGAKGVRVVIVDPARRIVRLSAHLFRLSDDGRQLSGKGLEGGSKHSAKKRQ